MTTKRHLEISGIPVEVVRKDIKNLHLGVYPPNGRVRVAVPLRLDDEAVRLAVVSRLGWIRRKQAAFQEQDRQTEREMLTGESHYYRGRRYRLDVIEQDGPPRVQLRGPKMQLVVSPSTGSVGRRAILERWYRRRLRDHIPPLIAKWADATGISIAEVRIKKMKTRWGSCTPEARRIWLNLELIKKPPLCLEYVLLHEMLHTVERHHNDRFVSMLDAQMPTWRTVRAQLNQSPLAHEVWDH